MLGSSIQIGGTPSTLPATTFTDDVSRASAKSIIGLNTGANGFILKNLKNSGNTGVSGTAKTVEIDIGGTAYYFLVSPTST